jgi:streptomycin 6-kinase
VATKPAHASEAFPLPRNLRDAAIAEGRADWLDTVPSTVAALTERWSLSVAEPFQPGGQTAWVAPARSVQFGPVVLKVAWRHPEADHEADGLEQWNGGGAVRLHASDERDDTIALLLERCVPGISLASRPEAEQDTVIAGLLPRLWREPDPEHRFRPLQVMCDRWADQYERNPPPRRPLDPGIANAGVTLFRTLPVSSERSVLLSTDLHAGNVLAAEREPWLAIDPKPYIGDPTYDALQHILNCDRRLAADPRGFADQIAEQLALDTDRLLLWLFARCVIESVEWPALADVARRIAP